MKLAFKLNLYEFWKSADFHEMEVRGDDDINKY